MRVSPNGMLLKTIVFYVELKKAKPRKGRKRREQIKKGISSLTKQIGEMANVITSLANTFSALAEKVSKKVN